jgi:hypothetical protein
MQGSGLVHATVDTVLLPQYCRRETEHAAGDLVGVRLEDLAFGGEGVVGLLPEDIEEQVEGRRRAWTAKEGRKEGNDGVNVPLFL